MGMSIGLAIGGAMLSSAMAPKPPKLPDAPAPPQPPQQSKTPSPGSIQAGQAGAGQAGGSPGVASTFLTGSSGVDPNSLNLQKNTLLGG